MRGVSQLDEEGPDWSPPFLLANATLVTVPVHGVDAMKFDVPVELAHSGSSTQGYTTAPLFSNSVGFPRQLNMNALHPLAMAPPPGMGQQPGLGGSLGMYPQIGTGSSFGMGPPMLSMGPGPLLNPFMGPSPPPPFMGTGIPPGIQEEPKVMVRSTFEGIKSAEEVNIPEGSFGPAAGRFPQICGYFNPYTIEKLFKPLMAVVGAYRSLIESEMGRPFNDDNDWLLLWTSTAAKETDYWMKMISRLYTAAAVGNLNDINSCLLKLCTGGFVTGSETRVAMPVHEGPYTWTTWRSAATTFDPGSQTAMQQIASRLKKQG